jgi:hypothetical protein
LSMPDGRPMRSRSTTRTPRPLDCDPGHLRCRLHRRTVLMPVSATATTGKETGLTMRFRSAAGSVSSCDPLVKQRRRHDEAVENVARPDQRGSSSTACPGQAPAS